MRLRLPRLPLSWGQGGLLTTLTLLVAQAWAGLQPGGMVVNNARLLSGSSVLAAATVNVRLSSTIAFQRYQGSGSATPLAVQPVVCEGNSLNQPSFAAGRSGNLPVLPATYPLTPTSYYVLGEPLFLQVTDAARNLDAGQIDSLSLTVRDLQTGDSQLLQLRETAINSGEFAGFLNTTDAPVAAADCLLSVRADSQLQADYNNQEALAAATLVDPYGVVFDSASGARLDGVRVRIVDAATGNPAAVFGDDGAPYPSTVITGSSVTAGALTYQFAAGEYRFPQVASGQSYKLLVDQLPPGYAAPTALPDSHFSSGSVPGGPYVVGAGSRQDDFLVPAGPPVRVDIPLDAAGSGLFVVKTAAAAEAAIGDFLPWQVQVLNTRTASAFTAVEFRDRLPPGLRYRRGSFRVDNMPRPDPQISADGRTLSAPLGTLAAQAAFRVSYVTEITAAARPGHVQNIAWAQSGAAQSNQARAQVRVREDLMRSRALLAGRVLQVSSCAPADVAAAKPVLGARIYLENGRYVLTDERGRWHFDDIRPGSHVLQLDKQGLPAHTEIVSCEQHTRHAGNGQSQFVDVQGGTLWQSDFYVRALPQLHYALREIQEQAGLRLHAEKTAEGLHFTLEIDHAGVRLEAATLQLALPAALRYVPASWQRNGQADAAIDARLQAATASPVQLSLGDLPATETVQRLSWDMQLQAETVLPEQAVIASLQARAGEQHQTWASAQTRFAVQRPEKLGRVIVFRPRFSSFSTALTAADRRWLDNIARDLDASPKLRLEVVGHSDNAKVRARNGRAINDNYALSAARAQVVAEYLRQRLQLPAERISISGRGADEPLADNKTAQGRERNRRVELKVFVEAETGAPQIQPLQTDSGAQRQQWTRWQAESINSAADTGAARQTDAAADSDAATADHGDEATGILSFRDGEVLAARIQAIRLRADNRLQLSLVLDGKVVPEARIGFRKDEGRTTLLSYIGVDMGEPGVHELSLQGRDPFGNVRLQQSIKVVVAGDITRMRLAQGPDNVADGRSPVRIKLELLDGGGNIVPAAVNLRLLAGELHPLVTGDVQRAVADSVGKLPISADGMVEFAPVTRSGMYTVAIAYGRDIVEKFTVYVRPEKRDWILVGLAEGTLAGKTLSGNMESMAAAGENDDLWQDGRLAFFAKGRIKGEWLLTLAYDSSKQKIDSFSGVVDPARYYTLYADASDPRYDAASREKLYLRIEKDAFYALFGDYNTGMTETELSRYSRTMTGLKSEYHDSRFDVNVFAADTGQAYQHDELRGNGTSGIYKLRRGNILPGSEKIRIEVRDRYKSEIVLSRQELSPFVDYSFDETRGEVFFRNPILSQDENFNPVWIVAEYEVEAGNQENINAGGRAAVKFADGRVVLGASAVRESSGLGDGQLQGLDAELWLSRVDVLRAEVAGSRNEDAVLGEQSAAASLLEWKRDSQKVKSRVYFREEEAGFGLGQQSAGEDGTRKLGAEARYQWRQDIFFSTDIFRQEMLNSGASREMLDVRGEYQRDAYSLEAGLRHASEDLLTSQSSTEQLTVGGRYRLLDNRLTLRANGEIGINGQSSAQDFPDRLLLGMDYQWRRNITLLADQEWAWSEDYNTQTTRAGVKYQPWKGANVSTHVDHETMEAGSRLRSGLGLGQRLTLTPEWTADLGYDRADTLKDHRTVEFNPAQPPVFGPATEDFWAAFAGGNYQHDDLKGVARLERRVASTSQQWNLVGGAYRELHPELAIAAGLTVTLENAEPGLTTDHVLLRNSLAWRPDRLRWLLLEQLDYGMDRQEAPGQGGAKAQRLVNNLNLSKRWQDDQLSLQYGAKYVFATINDERVSGYTDLMGAEWRHDLSARWDVGLRGSVLHSWGPQVMDYSLGVSVGVTPLPNAWVSLGFNFTGFKDGDFSGAEYSAQGVFLKLRLKVDQDSIRQIWNDSRGVFGSSSGLPAPATRQAASEPWTRERPQDTVALAAAATPMPAPAAVVAVAPPVASLPPASAVPVVSSVQTVQTVQTASPAPTPAPVASVAQPAPKPGAVQPGKPAQRRAVTAAASAAVVTTAVSAAPASDMAPAQLRPTSAHERAQRQQRVRQKVERERRRARLQRQQATVRRLTAGQAAAAVASTEAAPQNEVSQAREQRKQNRQRRQRLQQGQQKIQSLMGL